MKVNNLSLKQEGGQSAEQVMGNPQQESIDPAIQQISDFISQSISQGQNAAEVVMALVQQQVDQQTIGQALMMNGFEENDIMSLFEQMNQGQQPEEQVGGEAPSLDEFNKSPEELTQDERMHADDMSVEQTNEAGMSLGKSGIEIKPENEGKFTRWAEARGMSVQEAASKVMSNKDEYPTAVVKMANFAKNAAGWNKEYGGEQYQTGGPTQGKVGAVNNVSVNKNMNWQKAPLYINPMQYEYTNDNFSLGKAAAVAYGGYKDFLSGDDTNKDNLKDGFFRDSNKKSAIKDATKGNYYNYKITQDANDPNRYMADNTDLYNASKNQGSLRTVDQYGKDILNNSRFNYNVDTNKYDVIQSSRPIDQNIYDSVGNKNALAGRDYNYLKQMIADKDAKDMIMGTIDDPEAGLLSIDQYGQASSIMPGKVNPNEYNTYMGINKLGVNQNSMIPVKDNGQPAPGMFNTQVKTQYKNKLKHGGDLDKAQFGIPDNLYATLSQYKTLQDPQAMNDYFSNMGQTNYMEDTKAVADSLGQNQQQTFNATTGLTTPTFNQPKVQKTNSFQGTLNRIADSPIVEGYGKLSNFAVQGADVVNDYFRDQNINKAKEDNFNKLVADYQYSTAQDPFNKRGLFDINTGSAGSEGDRTTGLYMSKYGGENNTVNVDSNLLAKLIAAGADIEIL